MSRTLNITITTEAPLQATPWQQGLWTRLEGLQCTSFIGNGQADMIIDFMGACLPDAWHAENAEGDHWELDGQDWDTLFARDEPREPGGGCPAPVETSRLREAVRDAMPSPPTIDHPERVQTITITIS